MIEALQDLLDSDHSVIRDRAAKAIELYNLRKENKISQDEYVELIDDLADLQKIEEYRNDIVLYSNLLKACDVIMAIRNFSPI